MPLHDGQKFAGYTIVRLLGSGGMGEVYLAQHPRLPRRDALKILPVDVSSDEEYRVRFEREADLASTLWHPHIVGVHDRGEADGQLWISMDFVDGRDASQLMVDRYADGMPPADVAAIVTAVASALDYAHRQGLLHRDVKPANVILTHTDDDDDRRILLADFGIARTMDDISGLTATNMTVGTVAYCAPEQLMGEPVDGRADQYSLAATAYHLLTGNTVFPHTNPAVIISRHLNADPPPISGSKPELSSVDPVFAASLAKDPKDRYARCADFAQALSEQVAPSGKAIAAPTTPAPAAAKQPSSPASSPRKPAAAPTQQPRAPKAAAPRPTSAPVTSTHDPQPTRALRGPFVAGLLGALALITVVSLLLWQPWKSAETTATKTSSTVPQTAATPTASALPPVSAPSVSAPTATSPPPSTATPDAYRYALPGCYWQGDPPTERPATVSFQTCADGSQRLESMSWSSWDRAGAQGTGILSYKVCEPNCAEGHRAQYAVNVSAFNPRPASYESGCPIDVMFYSEMIVSFPASPPNSTELSADTTYLGRPAIRFTTSPDESSRGFLGNQLCY
jgi:serine/threonine protein kinase, bacterial